MSAGDASGMSARAEPARAALSLGGNVGDVVAHFIAALVALDADAQTRVIARSDVWRTKAWGKTDQPDFFNMAALVETTRAPRDLLTQLQSIERAAGRDRATQERWGPRPLDIDIVFYGDALQADDDLTLPHPRAHERVFVLAPLAQIAPDARLDGETVAALLAGMDGQGVVRDPQASARLRALDAR